MHRQHRHGIIKIVLKATAAGENASIRVAKVPNMFQLEQFNLNPGVDSAE